MKLVSILTNPTLIVGFVALWLIALSQQFSVAKMPKSYISPPELKHFSFGYKEVMADLMWIRAIQDFDFCSQKINEKDCRGESWLYHMIHQITELSPRFRMPHSAGAMALTIIINDYQGASKIFDKAVERFPNDWPILGRAAYHALFEEKDKIKAGRLMHQAGQIPGAPGWYSTSGGRLLLEGGEVEMAKAVLEEFSKSEADPSFIKRLEEKINQYKAQRR